MPACHVCGLTAAIQGHHVVPRASDGDEGPVVDLCASCHQVIHTAARAMRRGASCDAVLAHLSEDAADRARVLVQVILLAALQRPGNPHPLVSAVLDDPRYLDALKRFRTDSGFTSLNAAVNGMLRVLAERYGLLGETERDAQEPTRVRIGEFSSKINGLTRVRK